MVTRAEGRTLLQLDGRPAGEVYLDKLGLAGERLSDADFARLAAVHPLAQPELSGDVRLRHVLGQAPGGGLDCATHIPVNAAVEFTEQSPEAIVRSTWTAVSDALAAARRERQRARRWCSTAPAGAAPSAAQATRSTPRPPRCAPRSAPDPPPLAGLYTRGEVGRVRGAKGDRNHAVVVAVFA